MKNALITGITGPDGSYLAEFEQKVCLIIPLRQYLIKQKALPHLGVLQVASALKSVGCEVKVLDFADGYRFEDAEWYGITATTPDWYEVLRIRDWILENKETERIMVGGSHATCNPRECAENFMYVAIGDGEESAIKIVRDNCAIAHGYLKDIDTFHPDKEVIDLWSYEFYVDGYRATSMVTAYSCAWGKCAFCSRYPKPYNRVRYHSSSWCEEEIKQIVNLGFGAIQIYDDEFFTHPTRDQFIIQAMKEHGLKWRCFVRADYSLRNKWLIEMAANSGLREVLIGCESGSKKILKAINKGTTPKVNYDAIKFLHSLGVKVKCAMIIALPSESPDTLKETWKWCESVEDMVNDWDFTIFTPLPGSSIFNNLEEYDVEFDKCDTYTAYKSYKDAIACAKWSPCKIRTSSLSFEEIIEWRDKFENRFKV